MLAVDSNVVVRYLIGDDPDQTARVRALIDSNDVIVSVSVILESEWVLRTAYNTDRVLVLERLRNFGGHPRVTVQNEYAVAQALDWALRGLDFADALHLATTDPCDAFVSFDRALVRRAARIQPIPLRMP